MKRILLYMALAGVCMAGNAQTSQKLTASKANEYGLAYCLPTTVLDVTIETEHTLTAPGEFYNYANRHLGITNAVRQASHAVRVKSVTITPRGVANPDNRWLAQFKAGSTVSINLTDAGAPLSINADPAETAAPVLPVAKPAEPTPLEGEAARQAVTLEMTRSTSLAKKAELAAQRIFELREQRNDLISGNVDNMPPDGSALQVALNAIAAQEDALTAMFAGTTKTWTEVNTVAYTPGTEDAPSTLLCRISPVEGLVGNADLSGIPLSISMKVISRGELPVNEKGEVKRFPKGGVAYTIPGTANFTVTFNGRKVASADVDLAQLGATFGIEPSLFTDKKAPFFARFSPITGAIIELSNEQ